MSKNSIFVAAWVFIAAISTQAVAQQTSNAAQSADKAVAAVRTDGGVVMISQQNGAFVTVQQNQAVVSGDRLMVSKDSIATVVYNDGCEQKYDKAGIYKIESDCKRAAALTTADSGWTTGQVAVAVLGGAALGAVLEHELRHVPPVSR